MAHTCNASFIACIAALMLLPQHSCSGAAETAAFGALCAEIYLRADFALCIARIGCCMWSSGGRAFEADTSVPVAQEHGCSQGGQARQGLVHAGKQLHTFHVTAVVARNDDTACCVDVCGGVQVVKHDLLEELECALRDLRVVDPAYPHQFPTFMTRKAAIVLCIENIRVTTRNYCCYEELFIGYVH